VQKGKSYIKLFHFHLKTVKFSFLLNIFQFLRSLKNGALGNRLSRHGLATALFEAGNHLL